MPCCPAALHAEIRDYRLIAIMLADPVLIVESISPGGASYTASSHRRDPKESMR
ncbi:MAG: hypothetical protein OJF51_002913 [Nitrospira sp.]|jgi:hypothetical protein|nr:MAG: hypothetical protein OJF51_002913 [Nitrospira sp.]